MARFVVYPTPLESEVKLSPDSGGTIILSPYVDEHGRPGQVGEVADSTPSGHGATIEVEAVGFERLRLRGFLVHDGTVARLQVDDYVLTEVSTTPPPEPGPTPPGALTPAQICQRVYDTTHPNLASAAGCGKYVEDCCDALHTEHHPAWGHIMKTAGQNQFNGHAVDAVQLLINVSDASGYTAGGIYDIIFSSASAEAKPVFNYVEPPRYDLWYYPADAPTRGALLFMVPSNDRRR